MWVQPMDQASVHRLTSPDATAARRMEDRGRRGVRGDRPHPRGLAAAPDRTRGLRLLYDRARYGRRAGCRGCPELARSAPERDGCASPHRGVAGVSEMLGPRAVTYGPEESSAKGLKTLRPSIPVKSSTFRVTKSRSCRRAVPATRESPSLIFFAWRSRTASSRTG
jgi:hypothetical protein